MTADVESGLNLGIPRLGPAVHAGAGAFADVYRVRHLVLDRTVAVKIIRALPDAENRVAFERECNVLVGVSDHPYLVNAYGGGFTPNGRPYLLYDWFAGGSLATWIRTQGPLVESDALACATSMARALAAVHRSGLVHRDIKPANILLTADGEPALADVGIARVEGRHHADASRNTAGFLHAAPEVLEGRQPMIASDLYSMGSTLFEMLVGHAPYWRSGDETVWPIMKRVLSEPFPNPESLGVSAPVAAVIRQATTRYPIERYRSADHLLEALVSLGGDRRPAVLRSPVEAVPPARAETFNRGGENDPVDGGGESDPVDEGDEDGSAGRAESLADGSHRELDSRFGSDDRPKDVGGSLVVPQSIAGTAAPVPDGLPALASQLPSLTDELHRKASGTSRGLGLGSFIGLLAALVMVALAGVVYFYVLGGPEIPVRDDVVISLPESVDGPLEADRSYSVLLSKSFDSSTSYRLIVDDQADGEWSSMPPDFRPSEGRHDLQVEFSNRSGVFRTPPMSFFAARPLDAGFRASLVAIPASTENWSEVLRVFDDLQNQGHGNLEIVRSDAVAGFEGGRWLLGVNGFGLDGEDAEEYCRQEELRIPDQCRAEFLELR